jgi:pimeloyl-ACP methyl ester carboxylesterase
MMIIRNGVTLIAVAETSYAQCGDLSLAYQVFGDGPVELVFVGPIVTHVELFWAMPEFKAFFEQLSTFCRVLLFDKAGVGLSDPIPKVRLLEKRAAEIEAVMDAVGFGKPVLFGMSEGGPRAIVFAAKRPERTRALILYGLFAALPGAGWADLDRDPAELRARHLPELGEDYIPATQQLSRFQEFGRAARSAWGSGATAKYMFPTNHRGSPARHPAGMTGQAGVAVGPGGRPLVGRCVRSSFETPQTSPTPTTFVTC